MYNCLSSDKCVQHGAAVVHFAGSAAKPWQIALTGGGAGGGGGSGAGALSPAARAQVLKRQAYQQWAERAARLVSQFGPFVQGGVAVALSR